MGSSLGRCPQSSKHVDCTITFILRVQAREIQVKAVRVGAVSRKPLFGVVSASVCRTFAEQCTRGLMHAAAANLS